MTDVPREISFALQHRMDLTGGDRPHIVLLAVGQDFALEMLPNPFTPRSTVSRRTLGDLVRHHVLPADHESRFSLRDLLIAGQSVPDLDVQVGSAATLLHVDGILGFDFFERFAEIRLNTRTFVMTLVRDS
jgi:hypothetical protein